MSIRDSIREFKETILGYLDMCKDGGDSWPCNMINPHRNKLEEIADILDVAASSKNDREAIKFLKKAGLDPLLEHILINILMSHIYSADGGIDIEYELEYQESSNTALKIAPSPALAENTNSRLLNKYVTPAIRKYLEDVIKELGLPLRARIARAETGLDYITIELAK